MSTFQWAFSRQSKRFLKAQLISDFEYKWTKFSITEICSNLYKKFSRCNFHMSTLNSYISHNWFCVISIISFLTTNLYAFHMKHLRNGMAEATSAGNWGKDPWQIAGSWKIIYMNVCQNLALRLGQDFYQLSNARRQSHESLEFH